MMKKKIVLPTALVLGIILMGLISVSNASAQGMRVRSSIVQKIAERFNLNEADVRVVFEEERENHFAEMQAGWIEKLDDLVNDGKITAEQKQAILVKHEEMYNKMTELQDLSFIERKENMREIHEEFRNWSEEQGIDVNLVGPFGNGFRKGFGGEKFMRGNVR